MSKIGKVKMDFKGLHNFNEKLKKVKESEIDLFIQACTKEIAARLLVKAIKRTPVGVYPASSGKQGGTLRRGWTGQKSQGVTQYVQNLPIHRVNDTFVIEIVNPIDYAPYVEFGHRTRNHKGWVKGQFMLTISEQELQDSAPAVLERKLAKKLGEWFK